MYGGESYRIGRRIVPAFEHRHQRDHLRELEQVLAIGLAFFREPRHEVVHAFPARPRLRLVEGIEKIRLVSDDAEQFGQQTSRGLALGAITHAVDGASEFVHRLARADGNRRAQRVLVCRGGQAHLPLSRNAAQLSSVCAPTPRFGVVAARTKAGSSSSLAIRRRYAIRSWISERSNHDAPPLMRPASMPPPMRCATLAVITRVFPLPAPARTSSGPSR